ncbi:MAG: ATP-binding protein [Deltaproteobacteria bacterium]|nr:ATP-binding protein [Deltaproteobacteria bacterium]
MASALVKPRSEPSSSLRFPPAFAEGIPTALVRTAPGLVLELFLKVLILTSLGVLLVALCWGPPRTAILAGGHLLMDLLLFYRVRRGHTKGAAFGLCLSLWAVASYAAWQGHGTHDAAMVVLGVLMMAAGLLRVRWQSTSILLLTLGAVWAMGWAEMNGHSRTVLAKITGYDDVLILSILFTATWTLMHFLISRLAHSAALAQANDQNYQEIFDATRDALFVLHPSTAEVLNVNAAVGCLMGQPKAQLLGASFADVVNVAKEQMQAWLNECAGGGSVSQDRLLDRGGLPSVWIEINLRGTTLDGHPRVLAVLHDVHARHRLDEELRQADKLRALGHLAGGVAHDFNNQLTGILANAELLRLEHQNHRAMNPAFVDAIIKCAMRSADLTKQLLAFARKARPRREDVDVVALVKDVVGMLQRGLDPRVSVRMELPAGVLSVAADPSLLHNALLNLGINAKEAMPQGGELRFSVGTVSVDSTTASVLQIGAGDCLLIQVKDTGTGMDEATKAQIFDPFFTTKDTGTGMGLAAAYGTVRSHGGALCVQSDPGQGSTFMMYLPLASPLVPSPSETSLPVVWPRHARLTVWVVDDEPDVARTTEHMLKALGHATRGFTNAEAALAAFAVEHAHVSLFILDRVMPERSGDDLLTLLRQRVPQLPAVMVSGYSEDQGPSHVATLNTVFVQKPFGPADLAMAIERLCADPQVAARLRSAAPTA